MPKAYLIVETEILDREALKVYAPLAGANIDAAGGRRIVVAGRVVAFGGDAPKHIIISEWDSMDKVQAYRSSDAYKNLSAQREKALKSIRAYAVEGIGK